MDVEHRPAIAYRGALTAAGGYDALISFGPKWEWDIAASAAIALAAGATITDIAGHEIVFNAPGASANGLVIAGATLHPLLMERITAMRPRDKGETS
jgi:myo-inositol-1(or 4)-monophosphatase